MYKFIIKYKKNILIVFGAVLIGWFLNQLILGYLYGTYECVKRNIINYKKENLIDLKFYTDLVTEKAFLIVKTTPKGNYTFEEETYAKQLYGTNYYIFEISPRKKPILRDIIKTKDYNYMILGVSNNKIYFISYPDSFFRSYNEKFNKNVKDTTCINIYDLDLKKFINKFEVKPFIHILNGIETKFINQKILVMNGITILEKDFLGTLIFYNTESEKVTHVFHREFTGFDDNIRILNNGDLFLSFMFGEKKEDMSQLKCYSKKDKKIYFIDIIDKNINEANDKSYLRPSIIWLGNDKFAIAGYTSKSYSKIYIKKYEIKNNIATPIHETFFSEKKMFFPASLSLYNHAVVNDRYIFFLGGKYGFAVFHWLSKKCFVYDSEKNIIFFIKDFPHRIGDQTLFVDSDNNIWIAGGRKISFTSSIFNSVYKYKIGRKFKRR